MSDNDLTLTRALQDLKQFRLALLRLHKAMLDSERIIYEQFHGQIKSNTEFFQLVVGHDWFAWLRPISQFIVQIDDVLNSKEPVVMNQVDELFERARVLLQPSEFGTTLEKGYYGAIQRDPEIALMHADISDLLKKQKK